MTQPLSTRMTFVIVAAITLLAGCSRQEPAPAAAAAPATAPAAPPAPAAPAATPAPKWLASTQGDIRGITIAVQEIKRGPYALKLKLVLINESQKEIRWESPDYGDIRLGWDVDSSEGFVSSVSDVHLIDATNKKKYFVVRDSDGNCICSRKMPWIPAGSQLAMWAEYPLPPDDVQKISVEAPNFPPMEDIPISR